MKLVDLAFPPPPVGERLSKVNVLRALALAHDALDNPTPASIAAAQTLLDSLIWRMQTDGIDTTEETHADIDP